MNITDYIFLILIMLSAIIAFVMCVNSIKGIDGNLDEKNYGTCFCYCFFMTAMLVLIAVCLFSIYLNLKTF